jgi:plastocyanin
MPRLRERQPRPHSPAGAVATRRARTTRRTALALAATALMTVAAAGPLGASVAAKKAPVKLSGKVNNHGTTTARNGAVALEADSFYFAKTFVKTPAATVAVTVKNKSKSAHTFTVDGQDIDEELAPGKKITVDVAVTGAPVAFYCRFHKGSGMQGALFTKAGATASGGSKTSSAGNEGGGSYYY